VSRNGFTVDESKELLFLLKGNAPILWGILIIVCSTLYVLSSHLSIQLSLGIIDFGHIGHVPFHRDYTFNKVLGSIHPFLLNMELSNYLPARDGPSCFFQGKRHPQPLGSILGYPPFKWPAGKVSFQPERHVPRWLEGIPSSRQGTSTLLTGRKPFQLER
jgi:hypothetical protein